MHPGTWWTSRSRLQPAGRIVLPRRGYARISGSLSALTVDCSSTYSDRPSEPNSRPMPDCLYPPKGDEESSRVHVDAVGAGADLAGRSPGRARCRPSRPNRPGRSRCRWRCARRRLRRRYLMHRQDRAEDLLARDPHVVGRVGEQRRLDVPAAVERLGRRRRVTISRALVLPGRGCSPRRVRAAARRPAGRSRSRRRAGRRPAVAPYGLGERVDDLVVAVAR